jgi:hypothetical protein
MMTKHIAGCLALLIMLGGCANSREAGSPGPLAEGATPEEVRLQLVDQARWAMSAHNMQSWEIELDPADPQLLRVFLARDRLLPATDPFSRQILMSVGGFLALLEDAAAARGLAARIDLFTIEELAAEDSGASFAVPVAEVRIAPSSGPAGSWYPDAISGATVKADLAAVSLPPAQLRSYLEMNAQQGIGLRFVQDAGSLAELKPILKAAFRLEMQHEPTLMESYRLMRRNRRQLEAQPWGLSYGSNFPQKSLGAIELFESLFPMKMKKWGLRGADNFDQEVDKAVTFLIITTEGNSRLRQVQAGMLFQRLWLKAIHDGYAVVPASQPLQEYAAMAEHYRGIHRAFAAAGQTIQMIAFLGGPKDGYRRGFRLSVKDLVRQP